MDFACGDLVTVCCYCVTKFQLLNLLNLVFVLCLNSNYVMHKMMMGLFFCSTLFSFFIKKKI